MRIVKPEWVVDRDGGGIFSVDVHPSGDKFATSGTCVRIWSMRALLSEEVENDPHAHKLMATLGDHTAAVNCVRFSRAGVLASASDDGVIYIYVHDPSGAPTRSFGSEDTSIEKWKVIGCLRGHSADVVGLAWSPCGQKLASASFDNTVRMWNPETQSCIWVGKEHQSMVKGVIWDPVGSYIASQSDGTDKSVVIWNAQTGQKEAQITELFNTSTAKPFVQRPSWSPDGRSITATCAMKSSKHLVSNISRGKWTQPNELVGFKAPVVVTRFSPLLYDGEKGNYTARVAAGAQTSVTLWRTDRKKPVVVLNSLFKESYNGYTVLASSLDGSIACLVFDQVEIGQQIALPNVKKEMEKLYGEDAAKVALMAMTPAVSQASSIGPQQPMHVNTLVPRRKSTTNLLTNQASNGAVSTGSETKAAQKEFKDPKGRRRIIPLTVEPSSTADMWRQANQSIGTETPLETTLPPPSPASTPATGTTTASNQPGSNMLETRRVIAATESSNPPQPSIAGVAGSTSQLPTAAATIATTMLSAKRPPTSPSVARKRSRTDDNTQAAAVGGTTVVVEKIVNPQVVAHPPGRSTLELKFGSKVDENEKVAELQYHVTFCKGQASDVPSNTLKCELNASVQWMTKVSSLATHLVGDVDVVVMATTDGQLYFLSTQTGLRLFPPIMTGPPLCHLNLDSATKLLTSVCCGGIVRIWDLATFSQLRKVDMKTVLAGYQEGHAQPLKVQMIEDGRPIQSGWTKDKGNVIVTLTNGHTFMFHEGMDVWMRMSDNQHIASDFAPSVAFGSSSDASGIISTFNMQLAKLASSRSQLQLTKSIFSLDDHERQQDTIAHVESLISASLTAGSSKEFSYWFRVLIETLVRTNDIKRLRLLCESLAYKTPSTYFGFLTSTESNAVSTKYNDLLKQVISVMQRQNSSGAVELVEEFAEIAGVTLLPSHAALKSKKVRSSAVEDQDMTENGEEEHMGAANTTIANGSSGDGGKHASVDMTECNGDAKMNESGNGDGSCANGVSSVQKQCNHGANSPEVLSNGGRDTNDLPEEKKTTADHFDAMSQHMNGTA